jgi:hypothetical protein
MREPNGACLLDVLQVRAICTQHLQSFNEACECQSPRIRPFKVFLLFALQLSLSSACSASEEVARLPRLGM